jgi:hypothetical protein
MMSVNGPFIYDLVGVDNNPRNCAHCGAYAGKGMDSTHDCNANEQMHKVYLWAEQVAQESIAANCFDCGLPYEDFPMDTLLPDDLWARIAPVDGEGLLCANCIVARLSKLEPSPIIVELVPVWAEEYGPR